MLEKLVGKSKRRPSMVQKRKDTEFENSETRMGTRQLEKSKSSMSNFGNM